MQYQFLRAGYQSDGTIRAFVRGDDGIKYERNIVGFRPYFYAPMNSYFPPHIGHIGTNVGFVSISGENLYQVIMRNPDDVGLQDANGNEIGYRGQFQKHFEADIKFIRRFLIDTGIRSGFEAPNIPILHYSDLIPIDFHTDPIICFVDIEVMTKWRFPDPNHANEKVVAITVWDSIKKCYFTLLLWNRKQRIILKPDHVLLIFDSEEDIFRALKTYIHLTDPDIISGWNVFFDLDYCRPRAKKFGIYDLGFERCLQFDLLTACKKVLKKGSWHLKDFVVDDKIAKAEDVETFHKEWYEKGLTDDKLMMKFVGYNKNDVMYCVEIEKKHRLLRYYWDFKNFVGLEDMNAALHHSVKVDTELLRMLHNKVVLPSKPPYEESEDEEIHYEGANVFVNRIGLFKNVAEFDMSRYYPSIILAWNLSPERKGGFLCDLCRRFLVERDKYDDLLKQYVTGSPEWYDFKRKRDVVKFLLNAVYGYISSKHSRIYSIEIGSKVTEIGRNGLEFMRDFIGTDRVLCGDTDGLKVLVPLEDAGHLAVELNNALSKWCKDQSVEPLLKVKFEKYYDNIAFVRARTENRAAMKRYVCHVVRDEEGRMVDYIEVKGFDKVRGDTSRVTKTVQGDCLDALAIGDAMNVGRVARQGVEDFINGTYSLDDIAIPKTIKKRFEDYGQSKDGKRNITPPPFVRGALYANRHMGLDLVPGDTVKMLYVKSMGDLPKTDVISFLDSSQLPKNIEVDMDTMLDKTLRAKLEGILEVCNLRWDNVYSTKSVIPDVI